MAQMLLADGRTIEEDKFRKIHLLILGFYFSNPGECHEFAQFCTGKGRFANKQDESDLGESTRKALRKIGLLSTRQGASIPQENGEIDIYLHEVVTHEVRAVMQTLVGWKDSRLHLIDVLLPEEKPEYQLDLVA